MMRGGQKRRGTFIFIGTERRYYNGKQLIHCGNEVALNNFILIFLSAAPISALLIETHNC